MNTYERLLSVHAFLTGISTCPAISARIVEHYINISSVKPSIWQGNRKTITIESDLMKLLFTANQYGDESYRLPNDDVLQIVEQSLRKAAIDFILADLENV